MPLFNALNEAKSINGQLQEVICPRCRESLVQDNIVSTGKGIGVREVTGEYHCSCGYELELTERYPIIQTEIEHQPFMKQEAGS